MVGYESLHVSGESCAVLTVLLTTLTFMVHNLVQTWMGSMIGDVDEYYNMGPHANNTTNTTVGRYATDTPILLYTKTKEGWEECVVRGRYADYCQNADFTWKWIKDEGRMGWVQDDPDPQVTVFCSTGMRKSVDEIIKSNSKEQYN